MNLRTDVAVRPAQIAGSRGIETHGRAAQRRAWLYITTAFTVWCCLVVATIVGAVNYRRSATDSPTASLNIDRGIVLYQDSPGVTQIRGQSGMEIYEGSVLEASDGTGASLNLFDGTVAKLLPGARLQPLNLRTGIFNAELTRIELRQERGAVSYNVAGQLPFGRDVVIQTPHASVSLTRGDVTVWVEDGATRVLSYDGRGKVESDVRQTRFRDGQRIVATPGSLPREPLPIAENLIQNGDLAQGFAFWNPVDIRERGRQDVLGTRELTNELVAGRRTSALHVFRETQRDTHNETGLVQEINRDVSAYRVVNLTGWVKVNSASLSGGGYLGSEYPILFRVHFTDDKGGRQTWSRGFFYANPENRPTDIGEQIPRGEWYPFLARLHELPDRPAFIRSLEVVASGHDYDALASYIQIITE
jgi:hypothetical protein